MSEPERELRQLWRNAADQGINEGVDWPKIVRTLFADLDALAERLDRMRRHAISDPEMRDLHENAKAYSLANTALREVWGYEHSTTLEFLIKCGELGPMAPEYDYRAPTGFRSEVSP